MMRIGPGRCRGWPMRGLRKDALRGSLWGAATVGRFEANYQQIGRFSGTYFFDFFTFHI
jgi:hypothetical protein